MKFHLTQTEMAQNERYFLNVLAALKEGGVFGLIITQDTLIKRNGKLVVKTTKTWECLKSVVSEPFLNQYFLLEL